MLLKKKKEEEEQHEEEEEKEELKRAVFVSQDGEMGQRETRKTNMREPTVRETSGDGSSKIHTVRQQTEKGGVEKLC